MFVVDSNGVKILVYDDNPNIKGEQKLTHPMNLLNSALEEGMVWALKTCFRFSNMAMVWPSLIVIPNQSICLVISVDFSALTSMPAFSNAASRIASLLTNCSSVSAARAKSSMCVATNAFSSRGIIFCKMVDDTCGNDEIPNGDTVHVYGVAKDA